LPEYYEELYRIIKAKSSRVNQEQTDMAKILKDFVKKQEARERTGLIKTLKFYLDCLDDFAFPKILVAFKEEIEASKRETEEFTKTEMNRIKSYEALLSKPDQHIAFLKKASEKLGIAEKQLLDSEVIRKKLLADAEMQQLKADEERKKLQAQVENQRLEADAENKKLLLEKA
jgi:hypothetical protein